MTRTRRDVAFYAPWAGPTLAAGQQPTGGAEVQLIAVAKGLSRRGIDVALATYAVQGLPASADGVTVIAQRRPSWNFAAARRAAVFASTIICLLRCHADAIVQRSAGATTGLVAVVARLTGRRFVFSSSSTVDFADQLILPSSAHVALYRLGLRLADTIVVQTDEQADQCARRFGRSAMVIRSVAERAEPRPDDAPSTGFLWIGRIAAYKNPLACLDLAAELPDVPFTLVCVPGDAALEARVRERASGLANVELVGPLGRPALMERIASATAVLSTSDFEGMPNTLLEGWSRGVPALTFAHDPDGLIARHDLGRTAGGDPAALVTAARELWADRDLRSWRDRCTTYVREHHDPDRVAARWAAVLQRGLETGERQPA